MVPHVPGTVGRWSAVVSSHPPSQHTPPLSSRSQCEYLGAPERSITLNFSKSATNSEWESQARCSRRAGARWACCGQPPAAGGQDGGSASRACASSIAAVALCAMAAACTSPTRPPVLPPAALQLWPSTTNSCAWASAGEGAAAWALRGQLSLLSLRPEQAPCLPYLPCLLSCLRTRTPPAADLRFACVSSWLQLPEGHAQPGSHQASPRVHSHLFLRDPINWCLSCSYRKIMCNLDIIKRRLCNALEQTGETRAPNVFRACSVAAAQLLGISPLGCHLAAGL